MTSLNEWLLMGGYGWYVWTSYIAGTLIIALNIYLPLRQHRFLLESRRSDKLQKINNRRI